MSPLLESSFSCDNLLCDAIGRAPSARSAQLASGHTQAPVFRIRIKKGRPDPDPHGKMRIRIRAVPEGRIADLNDFCSDWIRIRILNKKNWFILSSKFFFLSETLYSEFSFVKTQIVLFYSQAFVFFIQIFLVIF